MITFEKNGNKFNFRAVGVIIHDGKVLVHRAEKDNFWALPGGRVEFQETSGEALVREMKEELGVEMGEERLLWVAECFFNFEGKSFHELGFYHLLKMPEDCGLCNKTEEFNGYERSYRLIFKWQALDKIGELDLYPVFLKHKLVDINEGIEHFVERE